MDNSTFMQVSDSIDYRADNVLCFFFCVYFLLHDFFIQLTTSKILKNEVNIFLVGIEIVELYDVRMLDIFHYVDFSFEQNLLLLIYLLSGIRKLLLFYDLYGDRLSGCFLSSLNNFCITSSKIISILLPYEAILVHGVFLFKLALIFL